MMDIKGIISNNRLNKSVMQGSFGIEKEGIRVDEEQRLSLEDHPAVFGDRSYHPYIQTDFSEAQLEVVTPPMASLDEAFKWMQALNDVTQRSISHSEYVWPFSMPAVLPDTEQIPIVRVSDQSEVAYREKLAKKYGKKKQLISGIHYNFAFSDDFIQAIFEKQETYRTAKEVKDEIHLKLARNFLSHQWILTYLFGAAPFAHESFFEIDKKESILKDPIRSIRNSQHGYHNTNDIVVRYDELQHYVQDVEDMVAKGTLSEEREFYGAARLRGKSKKIGRMIETGIEYVEFRPFDINPYSALGLTKEQATFIHLFFVLMIWMEDSKDSAMIQEGTRKNEEVSVENPFSQTKYHEEGLELLEIMKQMAEELDLDAVYHEVVDTAVEQFNYPEKTLAAKLTSQIKSVDRYLEIGKTLGQGYKKEANEKPYLLSGFETMEMSSQLLIFDTLQKGIRLEVLDEVDQFLKLSHKGHEEYVKNGNMTAKDTYISHWIMENKTVTKKILKSKGFKVPGGEEYQTKKDALDDFYKFENRSIVVKPKSTNYGLGITVFKHSPSIEDFEEAIDIAFSEDASVLVEDYAAGTEYRFFVLDGKVKAVLLRVPANVTGDGERSVRELIEQKNENPLRGTKHRAPLEKIQLGNIEKLTLKEQGYTFESIPEKGETVYLRVNSNISTGGDSIDFTDEMDESYKVLAEKMALPIGVKVTGIDLIIPDYTKPSTEDDPGYTVIEANFNPAMHMHAFVSQGKGRRLTVEILKMLFPEVYA
ncbi:bifunctional glutamate--cysteine ligase GshA/glutathione synthetase GshB [Marinilactibacillus sp. XAAS-LB27]|uniref:bifunctional glutamate--cysteine ligase GshA/glutathione synthetase GshB n=1 Tax=Marinilactibacillus sp. XAAS-LB27 TaxID=3114538 RepID=UPI002E188236|nr:bifunctional glutamate--cysteine ligase GshA/glutathione synthetase GshB [Marinilactibacillus sp. XAAS-LB27]